MPISIIENVINVPVTLARSAYQSYVATTTDVPVLTEAEWSASQGTGEPYSSATAPDPVDYPFWYDTTDGSLNTWDAGNSVWINTSHEEPAATLVSKIALAGDSILSMYTTGKGSTGTFADVMAGIIAYSGGLVEIIKPDPGVRDANVHAFGGIDTWEMANGSYWTSGNFYQVQELVDQAAAGDIDAVVVSLGANDLYVIAPTPPATNATYAALGAYDIDVYTAVLETEVVAPLVAAGLKVFLLTIMPTFSAWETGNGNRAELTDAHNTWLKARYAGDSNVHVIDVTTPYELDGSPGVFDPDKIESDGSHPYIGSDSVLVGKEIFSQIAPHVSTVTPDPWEQGEWVTSNPYEIAAGADKATAIGSTGNTISLAYVARTGGEAGERWTDVTVGHATQYVGSGADATMIYTVAGGENLVVQQYGSGINQPLSVAVTTTGDYTRVHVLLATNGSGVGTSTAIQVAAAVNAVPELTGRVVATYTGNGTGTVPVGRTYPNEVNTGLTPTDVVLDPILSDGDIVRAIIEIAPLDGKIDLAGFMLYLYTATGTAGNIATGLEASWLPRCVLEPPLDGSDSIIITTPWVALPTGRSGLAARFLPVGSTTFRIGRFGVQRKL